VTGYLKLRREHFIPFQFTAH